ncbi:MAG: 5-(carboxyamino)imidazole ribonucleotide synthase, partial [Bacteroidota bacterium]
IHVLDPDPQAPCRHLAHNFVEGHLTEFGVVYDFGRKMDVLTVEIENVNTEALEALQSEGRLVYPDPKTLRMIQDKREQKQFFVEKGIPTSPFLLVDDLKAVYDCKDKLPAVHKMGREGYDGRGVKILRTPEDIEDSFNTPGLLEDLIDFEKELAIIVSRNPSGQVITFPVVEMVFHPVHNLVEYLFSPADIAPEVVEQAEDIARKLAHELSYVGVLAIELFLTKEGEVLVNEIAPRPHNSGHHTIRANHTSQYEQHLRAILDLPLGSTDMLQPAGMVNLLGAAGHTGTPVYPYVDEMLKMPGVHPMIYGKARVKPFRKMGHVLILDEKVDELKVKAQRVRELAVVEAEEVE